MPRLSRRETIPETPEKTWLPIIFGKELKETLTTEEEKKIDLFEQGLANELSTEDTIETAMQKIVKMALAAEFGPSLVKAKGANGMIETIVRGIMGDSSLRKQALLIADRFAKPKGTR